MEKITPLCLLLLAELSPTYITSENEWPPYTGPTTKTWITFHRFNLSSYNHFHSTGKDFFFPDNVMFFKLRHFYAIYCVFLEDENSWATLYTYNFVKTFNKI